MEDLFSRLVTITSYLARRVIEFFEDMVSRDVNRWLENSELNCCRQHSAPAACHNCRFPTPDCPSSSTYFNFTTSFEYKQRDDASNFEDPSSENSQQQIVNVNCCRGSHFVFKGLVLPIFCFEFVWRSALGSWRFCCYQIRCMQARVQRLSTTLQGSSSDIGWLQSAPGMAPVEDGSARFRELLQDVRNGTHKLPDSFVYLLIPGLFSNHGPLYFVSTKRFFSKRGLPCHIAKIHNEISSRRPRLRPEPRRTPAAAA